MNDSVESYSPEVFRQANEPRGEVWVAAEYESEAAIASLWGLVRVSVWYSGERRLQEEWSKNVYDYVGDIIPVPFTKIRVRRALRKAIKIADQVAVSQGAVFQNKDMDVKETAKEITKKFSLDKFLKEESKYFQSLNK